MKDKRVILFHLFILLGYFTYLSSHEFLHYKEMTTIQTEHSDCQQASLIYHVGHDSYHIAAYKQRRFCSENPLVLDFVATIETFDFYYLPLHQSYSVGYLSKSSPTIYSHFIQTVRLIV